MDNASVVDNIRVGRFARGQVSRLIRWHAEAEAAAATLAELGCTVGVRLPAGVLSPADRAIVAIAPAAHDNGSVRLPVFEDGQHTAASVTAKRRRERSSGPQTSTITGRPFRPDCRRLSCGGQAWHVSGRPPL